MDLVVNFGRGVLRGALCTIRGRFFLRAVPSWADVRLGVVGMLCGRMGVGWPVGGSKLCSLGVLGAVGYAWAF